MKNIIQKSFRPILLVVFCLAVFPVGMVFAGHEPPPPGSQLVGPSTFATVTVYPNDLVILSNIVCSKGGKSTVLPNFSGTIQGAYYSIADSTSFVGFFFTGGVLNFGLQECYSKNVNGQDQIFAVDMIVESAYNFNLDEAGTKSADLVILGVGDKPNWPKP